MKNVSSIGIKDHFEKLLSKSESYHVQINTCILNLTFLGAVIIFTGLLSRLALGRKLQPYRW